MSGRLVEVDENGEVVWEFAPPNSRVFDAEQLENGNILVAVVTQLDSEECPLAHLLLVTDRCVQNRVLELDYPSKEVVWQYGGRELLHWPRDAGRLPNGNTLITDTFNDRVVEINRRGEVVWEYEGVQMPYAADRLSVPEEDHETVPGTELPSRYQGTGTLRSTLEQAEAYASFVFPAWVRLPELLALAGMVCCSLWLLVEAAVELARGGEHT